MTAVRPPIHQLDKTLAVLHRGTDLEWSACPKTKGTVCAVSRCRRYVYCVEAMQVVGFSAQVDLRVLVERGSLLDCIHAINENELAIGRRRASR